MYSMNKAETCTLSTPTLIPPKKAGAFGGKYTKLTNAVTYNVLVIWK